MHGVSLFATYREVWQSLLEFDTQLATENHAVVGFLRKLSTFRFKDIVEVMTDYTRKLSAKYAGLFHLPYTTRQLQAIERLTNHYPTDPEIKDNITSLISTLEIFRGLVGLIKQESTYKQAVSKALPLLYKVPSEYLWFIKDSVANRLTEAKDVLGDDISILTALDYLSKYKQPFETEYDSFEGQLVSDISTLLAYRAPHPEIVIALENALRILNQYYTPTAASRLFIDDVFYKIRLYIDTSLKAIAPEVMEWFRNKGWEDNTSDVSEDIDINKLSKDEIINLYQRFIKALNYYQLYNDKEQKVYELATLLKQLPFDKVSFLFPHGFVENLAIVDNIQKTVLNSH